MKRQGVLLAFIAAATCLFTFNSVQQLSSEVAVAERRQLLLVQGGEEESIRALTGAALHPMPQSIVG